ncbi:CcdB family protein [Sphingomonas sp. HF-S4]|uniref:Toxin CcdB n=1 Tax=Sphingomonas agrestis TaxID=3080540 RepID=A0ABU3Y2N0_9SPHN|nr:CcdB family protein [Sphingomonas sp. HF-S4]MDV3455452.1 CcdB family protein [Sphingomonas sp. HF-S4]
MARFGIYQARTSSTLLLDCQSDLVDLGRRLMVPLLPEAEAETPAQLRGLHPIFSIQGERFVMATHPMATVPEREIGAKLVSLSHEADQIIRAIDYLLSGY